MHSSRMCTAHLLPYGGSLPRGYLPDRDPPGQRPSGERPPSGQGPTPLTDPPTDRDAPLRQRARSTTAPHPTHGQTDSCENITFANFVCGWEKDGHRKWLHRFHVYRPPTRPLDPLLLSPSSFAPFSRGSLFQAERSLKNSLETGGSCTPQLKHDISSVVEGRVSRLS